jgi:hypothetical protein
MPVPDIGEVAPQAAGDFVELQFDMYKPGVIVTFVPLHAWPAVLAVPHETTCTICT